jgi:hypothetical protein
MPSPSLPRRVPGGCLERDRLRMPPTPSGEIISYGPSRSPDRSAAIRSSNGNRKAQPPTGAGAECSERHVVGEFTLAGRRHSYLRRHVERVLLEDNGLMPVVKGNLLVRTRDRERTAGKPSELFQSRWLASASRDAIVRTNHLIPFHGHRLQIVDGSQGLAVAKTPE